ncbi:MAG: hypothetical protein EOP11_10720 [Proteobacteria bacterium]|nr:MAG: hypothetical protein EOP11_10720 [Pseudomonadota bacterium]
MRNIRELDLIVIEKVMGWKFDPARAFSPSNTLSCTWEMEEYVLSNPVWRKAYGEAMQALLFPAGVESIAPSEMAVACAHASLQVRCLAALRAVGAPLAPEAEVPHLASA